MTRASTQKHEIVSGTLVVLSGVSKTEAVAIARSMNKGRPSSAHVHVRVARRPA